MSPLFIASIASICIFWILVFIKRRIHIKYLFEVNDVSFTSRIDKMFFLTPYLPEIYLYTPTVFPEESEYFRRKRKMIKRLLLIAYAFLILSVSSIVALLLLGE